MPSTTPFTRWQRTRPVSYTHLITLGDYIGMTQDEAAATEQVVSGQISVTWEHEYNLSLIHI